MDKDVTPGDEVIGHRATSGEKRRGLSDSVQVARDNSKESGYPSSKSSSATNSQFVCSLSQSHSSIPSMLKASDEVNGSE